MPNEIHATTVRDSSTAKCVAVDFGGNLSMRVGLAQDGTFFLAQGAVPSAEDAARIAAGQNLQERLKNDGDVAAAFLSFVNNQQTQQGDRCVLSLEVLNRYRSPDLLLDNVTPLAQAPLVRS